MVILSSSFPRFFWGVISSSLAKPSIISTSAWLQCDYGKEIGLFEKFKFDVYSSSVSSFWQSINNLFGDLSPLCGDHVAVYYARTLVCDKSAFFFLVAVQGFHLSSIIC